MATKTVLETEHAFLDITATDSRITGRTVDEDDATLALMEILDDMMAAARF